MDLIFNELSARPVGSIPEAYTVLAHFVKAVSAAQESGLGQVRLSESIGQNLSLLPLASNYTVGSWLNDNRVDSVVKERFRLIVINPPLLTAEETDALRTFEQSFFCLTEPAGKPEASGFGAAYLSDRPLLSFLAHNQWDTHLLSGWHWYLDDDGQAQTATVQVRHIATAAHVANHTSWLQQKQRDQLHQSTDLWVRRGTFFPHLILCGDVEKQLQRMGLSGYLGQVIDRLRTLDAFAAEWVGGSFDMTKLEASTNLRVSYESDSTMHKYSSHRRFKLPDGRRELFEAHIKIGNLRFHFYSDNQTRTVYVGYIGKHLLTATG